MMLKVYQVDNKNQFDIVGEGFEVFQSYDAIIAVARNGEALKVSRYWDYSKTTLKHFYIWLSQYVAVRIKDFSLIWEALHSNNKRKAIQHLIDKNIIVFDTSL